MTALVPAGSGRSRARSFTAWVRAPTAVAPTKRTATTAHRHRRNVITDRLLAGSRVMVGVTGFEPAAPASRTQCSSRLSYTPYRANPCGIERDLTQALHER